MTMLYENDFKPNTLKDELLAKLDSCDLYHDIVQSNTFQRLNDISFLGAIDYLYEDKDRQTRYEHTLSVVTLALRYAEIKKLDYHDEKYLVCAALLHDIGHGPLSHSMEPLFKSVFKLTHHIAGMNIILGKSPLGKEIYTILNKHKIDIDKLIKLLDGKSQEEYAFALDNPINVDTIDGIVRTYSYPIKNKKEFLFPDIYSILESTTMMNNPNIVDNFWNMKDYVYKKIINYDLHIQADNFSQKFVKDEWTIKEKYFYLTESEFKQYYQKLFDDLRSIKIVKNSKKQLEYTKRTYIINTKIKIDSPSKYAEKYIHKKIPATYEVNRRTRSKQAKFLIQD